MSVKVLTSQQAVNLNDMTTWTKPLARLLGEGRREFIQAAALGAVGITAATINPLNALAANVQSASQMPGLGPEDEQAILDARIEVESSASIQFDSRVSEICKLFVQNYYIRASLDQESRSLTAPAALLMVILTIRSTRRTNLTVGRLRYSLSFGYQDSGLTAHELARHLQRDLKYHSKVI